MADAPANCYDIRSLDANPDFDFINLCKTNVNDECFFSSQGDNPYELSKFNCMYSSPLNYSMEKTSNNLSLMSINLQSINAKYSELRELITAMAKNKSEPDIICVQELWQFPPDANFSIPGYHDLIYKLRRNNVQGGGVGIYVKSCFNFSLNTTVPPLYLSIVSSSLYSLISQLKTKKYSLVLYIDQLSITLI